MVNPGTFRGLRKQFLLGEKPAYASAVLNCCVAETLSLIQRRYFKRFPVELPLDVEPSAEYFEAADNDAADPQSSEEDAERQNPENRKKRKELIKSQKAQIKRWMVYQYAKDTSIEGRSTGANNPYNVLFRKLTGKDFKPPRKRSAANAWRKVPAQQKLLSQKFTTFIKKAKEDGAPILTKDYAKERDNIARETFAALPTAVQKKWKEAAEEDHKLALAVYKEDLEAETSTDPEDRQRAIQGLSKFVEPILDQICLATGWKATLIVGGPEPACGGRLNMMTVHSGTTPGDVKINFGEAERLAYKRDFVPIFGRFLRMCYSPDECCLRAIPVEDGAIPVELMDPEGEDFRNTFIHPILQTNAFTADVSMPANVSSAAPDGDDDGRDHGPFPYTVTRDGSEQWDWSPPQSPGPSSPPPSSPQRSHADLEDLNDMEPYILPGLPTAPVLVVPGLQLVTAQGHTTIHFVDNPEPRDNANAQTFIDALAGPPPPQVAPLIPLPGESIIEPQSAPPSAPPPRESFAPAGHPLPQVAPLVIPPGESTVAPRSAPPFAHPPPLPPPQESIAEPQSVLPSIDPIRSSRSNPPEPESHLLALDGNPDLPAIPHGYTPTLDFLKSHKAIADLNHTSNAPKSQGRAVTKPAAKKRKRIPTPEPTELLPRSRKRTEKGEELVQTHRSTRKSAEAITGLKKRKEKSKKLNDTTDADVLPEVQVPAMVPTAVKKVILKLKIPAAQDRVGLAQKEAGSSKPSAPKRLPGRPKKTLQAKHVTE